MTVDNTACRPMRSDDVSFIVEIERATFPDPWPQSAFKEILRADGYLSLVATDDKDQPVGYICMALTADEAQIENFCISKPHQRKGLGRKLMTIAESEALRRGALFGVLEVRSNNTAALALYGQLGYRRIGRRRHYYQDPPGDALVLSKPLTVKDSNGVVS